MSDTTYHRENLPEGSGFEDVWETPEGRVFRDTFTTQLPDGTYRFTGTSPYYADRYADKRCGVFDDKKGALRWLSGK